MQVLPINSVHISNQQKNNPHSVTFGNACPLTGIGKLKTESGQKIYGKIQKYLRLIGREGKVNDASILNDGASTMKLSIDRNARKTVLSLNVLNADSNSKTNLLNALFNENGQMINANLNGGKLHFERKGKNIRKIEEQTGAVVRSYRPVGTNDKNWDCHGKNLQLNINNENIDLLNGISEIFFELARLSTSIFK